MTTTSDSVQEVFWAEARLPSGRTVLVRTTDNVLHQPDEDVGVVRDVGFRSIDFRIITSTLQEVGHLISHAIRPLAPREAEVELGLGLNATTGQLLVLFGAAAAEASVKVNLRWQFGPEANNDETA